MAKSKTDVIKMPPATVLASLISQQQTNKSELDTLKGEMGDRISKAVDKHNLHAPVFKLIAKLRRMDAVKLMAFLTHFDDYRAKLELDKLAAPDLPGMGAEEEEEEGRPKPPMFEDGVKAAGGEPEGDKVGATTETVQ